MASPFGHTVAMLDAMLDMDALAPLLRQALAEDVGPGDVTSSLLVPPGARALARIVAKAPGVVAGVAVARRLFELACDGSERFGPCAEEGSRVGSGALVVEVEGPARGLLAAERTALNFLMRLSGIATLTARFVEAVRGTKARILDTRKTTPGLRALEKHAVRMGGGDNHRYALYDAVLVKENHLAFGGNLAEALAARPPGMAAIVEAETLEEFRTAAAAGADVVLLDDFPIEDIRAAVRERGAATRPLLEVSGGVRLDNVRALAETGIDRISIGALTHSAPALDLSLRLEPR